MVSGPVTSPHAATPDPGGYDPAYFARLFQIEDRHFWFRARNRIIAAAARQIVAGLPPDYRVLEVGCGTGNVLRFLERACPNGTVVGMDLFVEGLHYARRRTSCVLVCGDARLPPFRLPFSVIGLFDVLEHLPDDRCLLRDLQGMLGPGGALLLTVPAYRSLWSYFDEVSRHCRRYEPAELHSKLTEAGFQVEYLTPYMLALYPLVRIGRRAAASRGAQRRATVDPDHARGLAERELRIMPVLNQLLSLCLLPEARLIARRCKLPLGTSLLAVARKPA
jgi:SAM-dependent methyltransferase